MRLVDADKLILHLNDYALQESPKTKRSTGREQCSIIVSGSLLSIPVSTEHRQVCRIRM